MFNIESLITNMPPRWGSDVNDAIALLQTCRLYEALTEGFPEKSRKMNVSELIFS